MATLGLAACARVRPRDAQRPNVVVVIADDLSREDLSCYGGTNIETPHVDKLAGEGVRFNMAFTATAMCAPARMQLYTGLYPVRSGAYPNHSRVREGTKSVVHYLGDLGYRVGLIGKTHIAPREAFPFQRVDGKMEPDGDWARVESFMTQNSQQPFCLFVCSQQPHTPWDKGDASAIDPTRLELQPQIVDTPETREALCRYYAEAKYFDEQVGAVNRLVDETGNRDNTILMVLTEQGAIMPGAKWTCYEQGLRVGMMVRWPGTVEPGTYSEAMVNYVDVVPTLIEAAGGRSVAGLDGRSFMKVLKGETAEHNKYAYGVQTSKGAIGSPETGYGIRSIRTRDFKYIMNLNPDMHYSNWVTVNDGENFWQSWLDKADTDPHAKALVERYIRRPAEEFYDLRNDHYEMKNLADDPKCAAKKAELRAKLLEWMESQGDEGQKTEMEAPLRQGRRNRPARGAKRGDGARRLAREAHSPLQGHNRGRSLHLRTRHT
jgi:uncharacterized sulfatase